MFVIREIFYAHPIHSGQLRGPFHYHFKQTMILGNEAKFLSVGTSSLSCEVY